MHRLAVVLPLLCGCSTPPPADDTARPPGGCPSAELAAGTLEVDPNGPLTQIHPAAAWDGEGIWVAWTRPEPAGANFDIAAARLGVDGTTLVAPFQVDGGDGQNDGSPRVAVSGERVVVAWNADDMTGVDNLEVRVRGFARDGSDLDPAPIRIVPRVEGAPQEGNGWMPALAGVPEGGFALAGAWAVDGVGTFQALLQELDAAGSPTGAARVPDLDGLESHYTPSVATGPGGARILAWESWTAEGGTVIDVASLAGDGGTILASFEDQDDAGAPSLAWEEGEGHHPYLAWYAVDGGEYDIRLVAGDPVAQPASATLGAAGVIDHTPRVAAGGGGALVAWLRLLSGLRNELVIQEVRLVGDSLVLGEEQVLETGTDVAPYVPGLTWLCEDAWFVAWVEGENPDYVVKGRVVRAGALAR